MFDRFSTWWRAFIVVLLSLAAVTWPSASPAATTPTFDVLHQSAQATLSAAGESAFTLSLALAQPGHDSLRLSLYPRLVSRSQITGILTGSGETGAPISNTRSIDLQCDGHQDTSVSVALYTSRRGHQRLRCGTPTPALHLNCPRASCDGVYPLRYTVESSGAVAVKWSLLAVQSTSVSQPLRLDWIIRVDTSSVARPRRLEGVLDAVSQHPSTPFTIALDYRALREIEPASTTHPGPVLKDLTAALHDPDHEAVSAPPSDVDLAGLAAHGLVSQVSAQVDLAGQLLHAMTGRAAAAPVALSGEPSTADLDALATSGVSSVIVPESDLVVAPSTTLTWGAPFHVAGSRTLRVLASDDPLATLATDGSIEPGRRTAILLDTLALLHFEAPNAAAPRTEVLVTRATAASPTFVNDLANGLAKDPFVVASDLEPSFDPSLVGSDGAPATRSIVASVASPWSADNVASLRSLIDQVTSFDQAVASLRVTSALSVAVAESEIIGGSGPRQAAINRANDQLAAQLDQFSVNSAAITLTGAGTELPITILSRADYTVTAVIHLITDRLTFPKGSSVVTTLDSSTKSVRFPTANPRGSSLTLQVVVTTPDGQVVLARSAIQVRIAGTSWVGYVLTFASLAVLGLWWWRTYRRRTKGRHAR